MLIVFLIEVRVTVINEIEFDIFCKLSAFCFLNNFLERLIESSVKTATMPENLSHSDPATSWYLAIKTATFESTTY